MVSVAPAVSAAPGDTTAFDIGQGATPNDVVVGPDGNFWTVNRFSNSVSKITTAGQTKGDTWFEFFHKDMGSLIFSGMAVFVFGMVYMWLLERE